MKKTVFRWLSLAMLVMPATLMSAASCQGLGNEFCDLQCDCLECNDRDQDLCDAEANRERDRAAAYDCLDDYEKFLNCAVETADCDFENDDTVLVFEIDQDCFDDLADYQECLVDATDHNDNPF